MTRLYIQPSWIDSCEEHGLWSGGNDQYRGDRSVDFSTFDKNGRARVEAFSDAALEANKEKRKTPIPLVDRILPQQRRVRVLTEQLIELEAERKAGMDIHTYSKLRDVLICKRDRAEILYKKAVSVKPTRFDDEFTDETPEVEEVLYANSCEASYTDTGTWIDDLPSSNSLKKPIKKALQVVRMLVRLSHKAKSYWQELKEV